jgi:hypothetical protein
VPPLSQEQKHQALVLLGSNVFTCKVVALVGMSQSSIMHLMKVVGGKIKRQRGGHSKASRRPREEALHHSCN